jgi:hypothetical protein
MAAIAEKDALIGHWTKRCKDLLQDRNNLGPDDLSFLALKISQMRDQRLAGCITELIGWGTDERAELETFCAISLELMRLTTPSKVREAARVVEIRYLLRGKCPDEVPDGLLSPP